MLLSEKTTKVNLDHLGGIRKGLKIPKYHLPMPFPIFHFNTKIVLKFEIKEFKHIPNLQSNF